ncbi:hypothetical protein [uncultured Fibrobacter sp.]|uniref:hypothetical protein n=1 Tax=uncultured Fibrobacter sp. TaxID=261512 RepID=UPI002595E21E|nr:hypothetical protein [uncultured Fibrobacter sp.]
MKKLIALFSAFLILSGCAGVMGGGNPKIQSLEAKSATITGQFILALGESAAAYENALSAVGNKTEAERIKSEAGNLREDDDKDKLESSIGMLNEVDLSKELEQAGELSAEGKAQIGAAILHLGIAIFYDGIVATEVPSVVTDAKDIQQNLSAADAMQAGSIANIITNASWIADIAPDQLALLKTNFSTLKAYADAHGIPVPSQEEIEKEASSLQRE